MVVHSLLFVSSISVCLYGKLDQRISLNFKKYCAECETTCAIWTISEVLSFIHIQEDRGAMSRSVFAHNVRYVHMHSFSPDFLRHILCKYVFLLGMSVTAEKDIHARFPLAKVQRHLLAK